MKKRSLAEVSGPVVCARAWLGIALCLAAMSAWMMAGSFQYPDFSSVQGLSLVGSAAQAGTRLRITPQVTFQAGAAWYAVTEPVEGGFDTTFQFQITYGTEPPGNVPADGFGFVIQNSPSGAIALGGNGGDLGFSGISNSLAVEFDTYQNPGWEPNGNHTAIQSCGTAPNTANETTCNLGFTTFIPKLTDQRVHSVEIIYQRKKPGTLRIIMDGRVVLDSDAPLDLAMLGLATGGQAFVGFTGGTGGGFENIDILSWSFSSPSVGVAP